MKFLITSLLSTILLAATAQVNFTSISNIKTECSFLVSDVWDVHKPNGDRAASFQFQRNFNGQAVVRISTPDSQGCADRGETITFKFTDGTSLQFHSKNSYNCRGAVVFALQGVGTNARHREMLMNKAIEKISFTTMDKSVFIKLSEEEELVFRNALKRVING
jgi:hypothetical protein